MQDLTIDRIDVYAVGPKTERYTWASDMSEQYMTNNIVRLHTRGGLEGIGGAASYTDYAFDRAVAETMRPMLPPLLGASPHDRGALWERLSTLNIPLAPQAHSAIDIALWDLAAKAAGLPLHRFLGASRDRMPSYASTPLLPDAQAYVGFVADLRRQGFTAVKFHAWCELDRDLAMCRAVHERFGGSGLTLMLDVEQRYSRVDALRAARELEAMGFRWFEAPLPDTDLEGYRELRRRVGIPILPAGNWVLDPHLIALGIGMGCWSAARVDATVAGGVTPTRRIMGLADAHGLDSELQCWGYTLTQAANLHLMLAHPRSTYFEQPVPYPAFEHGVRDVIRTDSNGLVHAPEGAGLGIRIDWAAVEAATILHYEVVD